MINILWGMGIERVGRNIFISAIGSWGGQGILFNFSLGAEDDMVAVVQECIEQME